MRSQHRALKSLHRGVRGGGGGRGLRTAETWFFVPRVPLCSAARTARDDCTAPGRRAELLRRRLTTAGSRKLGTSCARLRPRSDLKHSKHGRQLKVCSLYTHTQRKPAAAGGWGGKQSSFSF